MAGKRWSAEDNARLESLLNLSDDEIALALGRSREAVKQQRKALGLVAHRPRGGRRRRWCLRCQGEFMSDGDRLCPKCHGKGEGDHPEGRQGRSTTAAAPSQAVRDMRLPRVTRWR